MPLSMAGTASTSVSLLGLHNVLVMPIQFIDGNKLKSYRMGLNNHITPLVINGLGGRDIVTHIATDVQTKLISRNKVHSLQPCTPGLKNSIKIEIAQYV